MNRVNELRRKKLTKAFAMIIMLCWIVSMGTITADAANSAKVKVSASAVEDGAYVVASFDLEGNPGIWGLKLRIKYDHKGLTLNAVETGSVFTSDEITLSEDFSKDPYVVVACANRLKNITSNGNLLTLKFRVNNQAAVGSCPVTCEVVQANNAEGKNVTVSAESIPIIEENVPNSGAVLKPTIQTNAKGDKITLQKKQKTTGLRITGLAKGDSMVSIESSNPKVVKVSKVKQAKGTCTLTAVNKGKATLTITLKSGLTKQIKVTVQTAKVKTKAITGLKAKLSLKRGKSLTLKPVLEPFTSQDKVKFSSSNKKVVTVTSKGKIKAKKKGKSIIKVKAGKKTVKVKVTVK